MRKWQKYWLYFLIIYSSTHLLRDILQDSGVKIFLSTVLVKKPSNPEESSFLWTSFNTYLIALTEITLSVICLKRRLFGKIGYLTIIIAVITLAAWLIYWFFL